jgi:hypothetical protein
VGARVQLALAVEGGENPERGDSVVGMAAKLGVDQEPAQSLSVLGVRSRRSKATARQLRRSSMRTSRAPSLMSTGFFLSARRRTTGEGKRESPARAGLSGRI